MATTSFKRKKFGMVKPVKPAKVKLKKPDVRELTRYYAAIAKYGAHQQLDNVCYAMNWWEGFLTYYNVAVNIDLRTTAQSRKIADALSYRKAGYIATNDKTKIDAFIKSIYYLESLARMIGFKVPALKEYVEDGDKQAKKHITIISNLQPRHERVMNFLAEMFPSCPLSIIVVPQIIDGVTGKELGRKIDHTKNTMYYSRKQMKAMAWTIRHEGILSMAMQEAWWLSRGMSFKKEQLIVDHEKWGKNNFMLMMDFEKWARRADTPSRLAKKPKKVAPKKSDIAELSPLSDAIGELAEKKRVEKQLATGEIVSMEPFDLEEYHTQAVIKAGR